MDGMDDGEFDHYSSSSSEDDKAREQELHKQHTSSFFDKTPLPHTHAADVSAASNPVTPAKPRWMGPGQDVFDAFEARNKRKVIWRYWIVLVLLGKRKAVLKALTLRYWKRVKGWKVAKGEIKEDRANNVQAHEREEFAAQETKARGVVGDEEAGAFGSIVAARDDVEAQAAYEKAKLMEELFRQEGIEPPPSVNTPSQSPLTGRSHKSSVTRPADSKAAGAGGVSSAGSSQHSPTSTQGDGKDRAITARTSSAMIEPERGAAADVAAGDSDSDAAGPPAAAGERRISAAEFAAARRADSGRASRNTSPSNATGGSVKRARPQSAPAKRGPKGSRPAAGARRPSATRTRPADHASVSSDENFGDLLVNPTGAYKAAAKRVSPTAQSAADGDAAAAGAGAVYAAPLTVIHPNGGGVMQGSAAWGWRRKKPEWESVKPSTRMPTYNAASDPHCRQLFERPEVRRHLIRTDKENRKAQKEKKTQEGQKLAWRYLVNRTYGRHNTKRPKTRPQQHVPRVPLAVDMRIVVHSGRRDRLCVIMELMDDGVKVRYEGHTEEYDEVIPWCSERLKEAKTPGGDPIRFRHPSEYGGSRGSRSMSPVSEAEMTHAHRASTGKHVRYSNAVPGSRKASAAGSVHNRRKSVEVIDTDDAAGRTAGSRRTSRASQQLRSRRSSRAASLSSHSTSRSRSSSRSSRSRSSSMASRSSRSSRTPSPAASSASASSYNDSPAQPAHTSDGTDTAAPAAAPLDPPAAADADAAPANPEALADDSPCKPDTDGTEGNAPAAPAAEAPPPAAADADDDDDDDDDSYEDDFCA